MSKFTKANYSSNCIFMSLYDENKKLLLIKFKEGNKFYQYKGVNSKKFNQIFQKGSIGKNFLKTKSKLSKSPKVLSACDVINIIL